MNTDRPGAYLVQGHLFFRMPDRSTILCKCIGEPFSPDDRRHVECARGIDRPCRGIPAGLAIEMQHRRGVRLTSLPPNSIWH